MISWHRPHGTLADDTASVRVTPENAGWAYSGLQVLDLAAGQSQVVTLDGEEGVIVPLSIRDVRIDVDGPPSVTAVITPGAVSDLGLHEGARVWLSAKATELDVYPA